MYTFKYGGKNGKTVKVEIADNLVVVRTEQGISLEDALESNESKKVFKQLVPVTEFPEADVTILQCQEVADRRTLLRDRARTSLKQEKKIRFAGRAIQDAEQGTPMVYTENLFVKFLDHVSTEACSELLNEHGLTVKRKITYAQNSYFVEAEEGTGLGIFQLANEVLNHPDVEFCHPEIIQKAERKEVGPQWHLHPIQKDGTEINEHVNAVAAWNIARGENITIAIIDDGVDVDHVEFQGDGKIVAPRDATLRSNDGRPKSQNDSHGTACAGVACANGTSQASGVAPDAKLMPIRLRSNLGSQNEADAFAWAADNGADVISCSWGPADGRWHDLDDPRHNREVALPDSTRLAIDYAVNSGRDGKGCVITWAAGNGNESVENDGYAKYNKVIAVAACNDSGTRSVYSDYGDSIWCTFPSSDFGHAPFNHPEPLTPGIWTVDRSGSAGYNSGFNNDGDQEGDYTSSFGGTSSACPGVAGVAALILSVNPELEWDRVKDIIKQSCERIDENGGTYNSQGHSPFYGFGRPNASAAVQMAQQTVEADRTTQSLSLAASAEGALNSAESEETFSVTLGTETVVELDGPDGHDFDLYVKKGKQPTSNDFDLRAWTNSADEQLTIVPESPARYFIMVRSYRGSGAFSLKLKTA